MYFKNRFHTISIELSVGLDKSILANSEVLFILLEILHKNRRHKHTTKHARGEFIYMDGVERNKKRSTIQS